MNIDTRAITDALLWPVNDVPAIFSIAQTGVGPALPALVEVGVVAGILLWDPLKDNKPIDIGLAYLAAAGVSFAFKALR